MTTAEQIRAINNALHKRLPGAQHYPAMLRELALDIHQAIADAAAPVGVGFDVRVQAGVDTLVGE